MARKLCRDGNCHRFADECTEHAAWDNDRKTYKPRESRPSRTAPMRGRSGWERQRRTKRFLRGRTCVGPGPHAGPLELDHIVRLADGGADDPSNWQALCRACHHRKTVAQRRAL